MKVKELLAKLEKVNPDAEVYVSSFCCRGNHNGDITAVMTISPSETTNNIMLQTQNRRTKFQNPTEFYREIK